MAPQPPPTPGWRNRRTDRPTASDARGKREVDFHLLLRSLAGWLAGCMVRFNLLHNQLAGRSYVRPLAGKKKNLLCAHSTYMRYIFGTLTIPIRVYVSGRKLASHFMIIIGIENERAGVPDFFLERESTRLAGRTRPPFEQVRFQNLSLDK